MDTATPLILNRDEMERRRMEAARELLNGISQSQVARKYHVSRTTASRWHRALVHKGVESLKKRRAPGRPTRLTAEQMAGIADVFAEGARAFGFPSDRWTTARLAVAIESRYGVRYDPDHVGRLMHRLGLRGERPALPPILQDTAATAPAYAASRYSPNTVLRLPEISPTVV